MRYLFYHYSNGVLIFKYKDNCGNRIFHRYIFYTLKEAIRKLEKTTTYSVNTLKYKSFFKEY